MLKNFSITRRHALAGLGAAGLVTPARAQAKDRVNIAISNSTGDFRSEEHTSEL